MSKNKKRFTLGEIDNRLSVKYSKTEGIYNWGDDNAQPSLIQSLVGSSVTAKGCASINATYIAGDGFEFTDSVTDKRQLIVNKKGQSINKLLLNVADELSKQNNVFLHVNYNALFEITSVTLLPCTDVRIGEADSTGYSGKMVVYNNWDKTKGKSIKKDDFVLIDVFNPLPEVIEAQVKAAGDITKFKGQILHITTDFVDTYSDSDAAGDIMFDMNLESRLSRFRDDVFAKGRFGSTVVVTPPFKDEQESKEFRDVIDGLKGSDKTSGIAYYEADAATDDLSKQLYIENIDSNVNLSDSEIAADRIKQNIINAFNVPSILVNNNNDASIFGNSGELLKTAQKMHWTNKTKTRMIVEEAFETLFSLWYKPINPNGNWNIKTHLTE